MNLHRFIPIWQKKQKHKMKAFATYLQEKNYSNSTISTYCKYIDLLTVWALEQNMVLHELRYKNILSFVRECTLLGKSKKHINQYLTVIRLYWNYLVAQGKVKDNIATGIFLKGITRRLPHGLFSEEELLEMYEKYPQQGMQGKRNKAILGLMIFQGLGSGEIKKLEMNHIRLHEGEIDIVGDRRSNARKLPLHGKQILQLHEYIHAVRPLILAFHEKESPYIMVSTGKSVHLQNTIDYLFRQVKSYTPKLKSLHQIKASVLSCWLKQFNLREVQYKAGHRYVISTERYQQNNIDDLKNEVRNFHPLK